MTTLSKLSSCLILQVFGLNDQRFLGYFLGIGSMVAISLTSFLLLSLLPLGRKDTAAAQKVMRTALYCCDNSYARTGRHRNIGCCCWSVSVWEHCWEMPSCT